MSAGEAHGRTFTRVRLRVDGRVQGVGYRASTQDQARRLGLTGWVRNLGDGAVELEAQGPADALAALEAWCHRGPSLARVSSVRRTDLTAADGEAGFVVRR